MRYLLTGLLLIMTVIPVRTQDYRSQISLIRPKPENCMIYGPISVDKGILFTEATVSLIDRSTLETVEKLQTDRNAWYLFSTVRKGHKYALLVEKEGFFPYYHEFMIPVDLEESQLEKPVLLPADLQSVYSLYYVPSDTAPGPQSRIQIERLAALLKKNQDLTAILDPMGDSLDPIRVNQLTSLFVTRGIRLSQIKSGAGSGAQEESIRIELKTGTDESGITFSGELPLTDDSWTIQFSASRNKLNKKSFKGLDPVHEFKGKDGFYRYTYGTFLTKEEAAQKVQVVKKKGFNQAFAKPIGAIKKL